MVLLIGAVMVAFLVIVFVTVGESPLGRSPQASDRSWCTAPKTSTAIRAKRYPTSPGTRSTLPEHRYLLIYSGSMRLFRRRSLPPTYGGSAGKKLAKSEFNWTLLSGAEGEVIRSAVLAVRAIALASGASIEPVALPGGGRGAAAVGRGGGKPVGPYTAPGMTLEADIGLQPGRVDPSVRRCHGDDVVPDGCAVTAPAKLSPAVICAPSRRCCGQSRHRSAPSGQVICRNIPAMDHEVAGEDDRASATDCR